MDTTYPGHYNQTETMGDTTDMNYTVVYPSSEVGNLALLYSVLTVCVYFSTTQERTR